MEMTLRTGAFEALDNREMMEIDGGFSWVVAAVITLGVMVTCKGCSDADHGK